MAQAPSSVAVHRGVLSDGVYEALKAMIMDRDIEPDSKINMDRLATSLEVSPTPVREALARLEGDGLVIKRPLVGYTAAPLLDEQGVDELYELRSLVEPAAAGWAAGRITKDAVSGLRRQVRDARAASKAVSGGDYESYRQFAAFDSRLHETIAEASGRKLLLQTIQRLHPHAQLYRLYFRPGVDRKTIAEHAAIVRAIDQGDPEQAARAMTEHLAHSRDRVRASLTKPRAVRD